MKPTVASSSGGNRRRLDTANGKMAVDGEKEKGHYWAPGCNSRRGKRNGLLEIATTKQNKVHGHNSNTVTHIFSPSAPHQRGLNW